MNKENELELIGYFTDYPAYGDAPTYRKWNEEEGKYEYSYCPSKATFYNKEEDNDIQQTEYRNIKAEQLVYFLSHPWDELKLYHKDNEYCLHSPVYDGISFCIFSDTVENLINLYSEIVADYVDEQIDKEEEEKA